MLEEVVRAIIKSLRQWVLDEESIAMMKSIDGRETINRGFHV